MRYAVYELFLTVQEAFCTFGEATWARFSLALRINLSISVCHVVPLLRIAGGAILLRHLRSLQPNDHRRYGLLLVVQGCMAGVNCLLISQWSR